VAQASPQPVPTVTRADRTRRRILQAAAQCFAQSGSLGKTTVEEIAASAGVSKGIVYHHFRGKERILEALLERTLAEWSQASDVEAHRARTGSVLAAIERSLRASLAYARTNPLVPALFRTDPLVALGLGESAAVRRSVAEGRARSVVAMRAGVAAGELRADLDPERATDLLQLVVGAFLDHLLNPRWIDATDEALVSTCLEVLRRGLRAEDRP
jgi:TetR/AcrR family acrAB operon transcriptional repressor